MWNRARLLQALIILSALLGVLAVLAAGRRSGVLTKMGREAA